MHDLCELKKILSINNNPLIIKNIKYSPEVFDSNLKMP